MNRNAARCAAAGVALAALLGGSPARAQIAPSPPASSYATAPASEPQPPYDATPRRSHFPMPTLRFGFGSHVPLNAAAGADSGFAFDLAAGVTWLPQRDDGVQFITDLGYANDVSDTRGGHFFTAGGGVLYGSAAWGIGVTSRALVGDSHREFAYGVRSSLVVHVLATILSVEVGHQWVRAHDEDRHELRWTISISPIPLVVGVIGLFTLGSIFRGAGRTVDTAISHPGDFLVPSSQRAPR